MKNLIGLALCLGSLIFASVSAFGRTAAPGKGTGIPEGGGSEPIRLDSAEKNPDTVRGTCNLSEGAKTSFSSPCVNIVIELLDESGAEISRTRTSTKGAFKFSADKSKTYRIKPVSKAYVLVSPRTTFRGGDTVDLQLQQKQ